MKDSIKLKVLALLTIASASVLILLAFVLDLPVAYVPENASKVEFITYHAIFVTTEVILGVYLLMLMLTKADLDISDILSFRLDK